MWVSCIDVRVIRSGCLGTACRRSFIRGRVRWRVIDGFIVGCWGNISGFKGFIRI